MKTKCEVYSRVVGYLRPVQQWNDAKSEEFKDRELFNVGEKQEKLSASEKQLEATPNLTK